MVTDEVLNKLKKYLTNYLDGSLQYVRVVTDGMDYYLDPAFVKALGLMGFGHKLTPEEVEYWKTQVNILEEYVNNMKALIGEAQTIDDFIALGDKFEALDKNIFGKRQATSA